MCMHHKEVGIYRRTNLLRATDRLKSDTLKQSYAKGRDFLPYKLQTFDNLQPNSKKKRRTKCSFGEKSLKTHLSAVSLRKPTAEYNNKEQSA